VGNLAHRAAAKKARRLAVGGTPTRVVVGVRTATTVAVPATAKRKGNALR